MERKLITVAEFECLSPAEQDAAFEASIVWDLKDAPPGLVERARARVEQRIAQEEAAESRVCLSRLCESQARVDEEQR